jgi:UDP-N-acetylglucosamine 2-epimerase (non-hydrolysing)
MKKLLFIFGTRPEAIKMAPLVISLKKEKWCEVKIAVTAQHRQMLDQVLVFFELTADFDLGIMKPNQTLFDITSDSLIGLEKVLNSFFPDLIFVQGDTTTAFAGALAGFYRKIPIAHIEAGLRSHEKYSPFPEEINRKMVSILADYHFAPTPLAAKNLGDENIKTGIHVVGNTVIDALLLARQKVQSDSGYENQFPFLIPGKKIILVTGHRRESFGEPFEQFCHALKQIVNENPEVQIIYPVHLNPNVQEPVFKILDNHPRISLIKPLEYPQLVYLMDRSNFVITDSGGIQEEAPSLGKPVLVTRSVTERVEGIEAGTAILVGTNREKIVEYASKLLNNNEFYKGMAEAANPYGDGSSCKKIIDILKDSI